MVARRLSRQSRTGRARKTTTGPDSASELDIPRTRSCSSSRDHTLAPAGSDGWASWQPKSAGALSASGYRQSPLLVRRPPEGERAVLHDPTGHTERLPPCVSAPRSTARPDPPGSWRAVLLGGPRLFVQALSRSWEQSITPGVNAAMPPVDLYRLAASDDRLFVSRRRATAGSTPTPVAQKLSCIVTDGHAVDLAPDRTCIAAGV